MRRDSSSLDKHTKNSRRRYWARRLLRQRADDNEPAGRPNRPQRATSKGCHFVEADKQNNKKKNERALSCYQIANKHIHRPLGAFIFLHTVATLREIPKVRNGGHFFYTLYRRHYVLCCFLCFGRGPDSLTEGAPARSGPMTIPR